MHEALPRSRVCRVTSTLASLRAIRHAVLGAALVGAISPNSAHAEVTRFEVHQTTPAFEGRSFGNVGPYVRITARATFAVDPADPRNAVIADLQSVFGRAHCLPHSTAVHSGGRVESAERADDATLGEGD